MEKVTFNSFAAADQFCDLMEAEGHEHVSMINDGVGNFIVSFGTRKQEDWKETFSRHLDKMEAHKMQQHMESCERQAIRQVAGEKAEEMGLSGNDAAYFSMGFLRVDAKKANPRKDGKLEVFRAGRVARNEMSREIRALTNKLYYNYSPDEVRYKEK